MALQDGPRIRVSHTRDMKRRLDEAWSNVLLIIQHYERLELEFRTMVQVRIGQALLARLVFPNPRDPDNNRAWRQAEHNRESAAWLYENGEGNKLTKVAGILWAAYNGVTELIDHGSRRRSRAI